MFSCADRGKGDGSERTVECGNYYGVDGWIGESLVIVGDGYRSGTNLGKAGGTSGIEVASVTQLPGLQAGGAFAADEAAPDDGQWNRGCH